MRDEAARRFAPREISWPEFNQMIEWQLDRHGVLLAQRGNSRDSVVVPAVSAALAKQALAAPRFHTNLRRTHLTTMAIAVTAAHNFANNSPWRV
jgi:Acetylglutamate kinase